MKTNIDFSIFSAGSAFGKISGDVDCLVVPMVGDIIAFTFAPNNLAIPFGHNFGGHLKVTDRIIVPNRNESVLTLVLEDMVIGTQEQALNICRYLEAGFGLHVDIYDDVV